VRKGWAGSRWLLALQTMWVGDQLCTWFNKHMLPLCGIKAAMPSRCKVAVELMVDS
jgi:hypothetical protein